MPANTTNTDPAADRPTGARPEAEGEGGYISNGMFVAAAIACGFKVAQVAPESANAWLNMSVVRPTNPTLELTLPGRRGGAG